MIGMAKAFGGENGFLLHGRFGITDAEALVQILPKEFGDAAQRRTRIVIAITAAMMVVEIAAGTFFHSMALLADGWHMGTQRCCCRVGVGTSPRHQRYPARPHA